LQGSPRPFHLFVLAGVVLILYANILPNPFVWDDHIFILQNEYVKSPQNIPHLFQSNFFSKSLGEATFEKGGYYRPLTMVFYTLEYQFWGTSPMGYHAVSILLHLLNVYLVFLLIKKLLRHETPAFLGALFFAVHPLHTETVSYLPSRGDLWASLFGLTTLLLFLSSSSRKQFLSLLTFIGALLSKENAMMIPILAVGFFLFPDYRNKKKRILWGYGGILSLYLMVRFIYFPFPNAVRLVGDPGLFLRILSCGKLVLLYLSLLIFPYPLHLERSFSFQSSIVSWETFAFLGCCAVFYFLGRAFWKKEKAILFGMG